MRVDYSHRTPYDSRLVDVESLLIAITDDVL